MSYQKLDQLTQLDVERVLRAFYETFLSQRLPEFARSKMAEELILLLVNPRDCQGSRSSWKQYYVHWSDHEAGPQLGCVKNPQNGNTITLDQKDNAEVLAHFLRQLYPNLFFRVGEWFVKTASRKSAVEPAQDGTGAVSFSRRVLL